MVKFGKNKLKVLKKLDKKQNDTTATNKVIKKKVNAEKKVAFQKEVLLKEAFKSAGLVNNISTAYVSQKKSEKAEALKPKQEQEEKKIKLKPVLKQKKRQKMQIDDTKLLLGLMKKIR